MIALAAVLLCLAIIPLASAQVQVNSAPNIVGSGARALGMGGAFIAVADDATAASWNPGGLTQLERPEMSLVLSHKWFGEDTASTPYLSPHGDEEVSLDDINYLSVVYPIPWTIAGRNLVLSLNYQQKYEFDRTLNFRLRMPRLSQNPIAQILSLTDTEIDFEQEGRLGTLSPAFGFELTDKISFGVVMNIWDSSLVPGNEWERTTERRSILQRFVTPFRGGKTLAALIPAQVHTYEEFEDVEGQNYTFGVLYKPTERLSIGAVYHTAYSTDVKYKRETKFVLPFGFRYYKSKIRIDWPKAYGLGIAYRFPNDKLTLSMDVSRRDWSDFVQIDNRQGLNDRISPITQLPMWNSPQDSTYSVRLGGEYVFVDPSKPRQRLLPSLRAGLYYDPQPASGRRDRWWGVSRGDGKPDDYYGVTLGGGLLIGSRVNIDLAYEYRWGNNVRKDTLAGAGIFERGFDTDVDQHSLYLSTVIYF